MSESRAQSVWAGRVVTFTGTLINAFLILLKLLGGVIGNSQALIADAVHSVSDLLTDAVVLLGLGLGRKAPDEDHHFGHARIETLASAIVGLALIVVALYLGMKASRNIYRDAEYHPTLLALVAAGVSIILKEGLFRYTVKVGKRIKSPAVIANAWHHRSDALSSVAVLLGVAGARFNPAWHILDAYAALLVSVFIIKVGVDVLRDSLSEFTDAAPDPEIIERIGRCTRSVEGVTDMHDLKVRTSGGLYQMEVHIVVDGRLTVGEGHGIAKAVRTRLIEEMGDLERIIVHVDPMLEQTTPK